MSENDFECFASTGVKHAGDDVSKCNCEDSRKNLSFKIEFGRQPYCL